MTIVNNGVALVQEKTICSYPSLLKMVSLASRALMSMRAWQLPTEQPSPSKYVMIVAPHTSNWDFFLMVAVASSLGRQIRFMGKHQLFVGPLGVLLRWLGGVAVERDSQHDFVTQLADLFRKTDNMVLVIAPEGTRSKVTRWKGGFYHIAVAAKVPVIAAGLDYAKKTISLFPPYHPSGDFAQDLANIQARYRKITAKYPAQDGSYPDKG